MKKKIYLLANLLLVGGLFCACSSDNDSLSEIGTGDGGESKPFSEMNAEEIKLEIRKEGEKFVNLSSPLKENKGVHLFYNFTSNLPALLDASNPEYTRATEDYWQSFYGEYEGDYDIIDEGKPWERKDLYFNKTKAFDNNQLVVKMPIKVGEEENNGTVKANFTISDVAYNGVTIPSKVDMALFTNDIKLGDVAININKPNQETLFSKLIATMVFENQRQEFVLTKDDNKNRLSWHVKSGNNTLLSANAAFEADINQTNIEQKAYSIGMADLTIDFLDKLQIIGVANLGKIDADIKLLETSYSEQGKSQNSEEFYIARTKIINDNMNLNLVSKTDGTKLAKLIVGITPNDSNYYDTVLYMLFSDDSRVEMYSYLYDNFKDIYYSWRAILDAFKIEQ